MNNSPEKLSVQELKKLFKSHEWRLNNLYLIIDKQGKLVHFRMNKFQKKLFDNKHNLNVVLKARQLGMTTFWCLYALDLALFSRNKFIGIVAHTKEDAQEIFDKKIKFTFDNLPAWLKEPLAVNTDNIRELNFSNGSSIRVGTSMRGGTLQFLLITEFGRTCQKYPEKAEEIMTGSLNTVAKGQMVVIESTAKGREGHFYDICLKALSLEGKGEEITSMDYKIFFFPWFENEEYTLEGNVNIPTEFKEYFESLEKKGINLTEGQKKWYVKKAETQKDEMKSEYPTTPEEAFQASMEGSYYGKFVDKAFLDKKIGKVPYDPRLQVDTYWDLGIGDQMAILFVQVYNKEVRIIDSYSSSGEGLQYYANILQEKKYIYGSHTAPHDIEVRELGTGKSRKELARGFGIYFRVAKKLPIEDGIEAGRILFPRLWIDEEKNHGFLKAIAHYKKEWDEDNATFKNKPLHDWSSHYADAFRTLAMSLMDSPYNAWVKEEDVPGNMNKEEVLEEDKNFNKFGVVGELIS